MRIGSQAAGISWDVTSKCVSLSVAGSICDPQINIPLANSWTIRNKPQAHDSDNQKVSKPSPTAAIVRGSARENNCAFQEPKDIRRAGSKDKTTISLRKNNPNAVPNKLVHSQSLPVIYSLVMPIGIDKYGPNLIKLQPPVGNEKPTINEHFLRRV